MDSTPASDETKTQLENAVIWMMADKLPDASTPIATKKFLTPDNVLVYLTVCNVAASSIPRVKVQIYRRVEGGVRETGYGLFGDHRLERYENAMLFGTASTQESGSSANITASEAEARKVIEIVTGLTTARQTL